LMPTMTNLPNWQFFWPLCLYFQLFFDKCYDRKVDFPL
jgi:hypothetical protein